MTKAPAKTRAQHVAIIRGIEKKTAESLIELGRALTRAKADIPHGEFTKMLRDDLHMNVRFARALMRLGCNQRFAKGQNLSLLPPTLSTLSILAKESEEEYEAAKASGAINPHMRAKDARSIAVRATVTTTKPTTYTVPMTVQTETVDLRPPGYAQSEPEEPHVFNPASRDEEKRRTEIEWLDRNIDHVLERMNRLDELGLYHALAEIDPDDREALGIKVNEAIAALTVLHEALAKPPLEGKVVPLKPQGNGGAR
jgi:Protein of unknown function (DUF3102)